MGRLPADSGSAVTFPSTENNEEYGCINETLHSACASRLQEKKTYEHHLRKEGALQQDT